MKTGFEMGMAAVAAVISVLVQGQVLGIREGAVAVAPDIFKPGMQDALY